LLRALRRLRSVLLERSPDFILSFMNKYNVFCVAAFLGTRLRLIVAERDSPTERLSWVRVVLRKLSYPLAAGVLVQSRAAREFILATTAVRRVAVLRNPVSKLIDRKDRRPSKVILNVARLHPKKGQLDLLEAFAQLEADEWRLAFCGDGPVRAILEERSRVLGIADRVDFFGAVSDLRPHLASAGIFAFASYWEGFPNSLAEAMLAGIPCVSYDCPTGPSDLIDSGVNGILVPVGDVQGLRLALARLVADTQFALRLGEEAAQVAAKVELQAVSRQYWDVCVGTAADSAWA
jgi:GalNAc-alpha-(1->4)-GalNAc-alpha-(1->3)-diNAcBac-PP-undecaprenol alpha-1,4-N-acetyl-D-galactosaminyltransferase